MFRYYEHDGEVRQALSVFKRRAGPHERTIRDLRLGPSGIEIEPMARVSWGADGQPVYTGSKAELGSHDRYDNAASDQMCVLVLAPAGAMPRPGMSCRRKLYFLGFALRSVGFAGASQVARCSDSRRGSSGSGRLDLLARSLRKQPPWSDFPLVLLIGARNKAAIPRILEAVGKAGSLTFLKRPMMREALVSAVRVALGTTPTIRVRDHLREREHAAAGLRESEERFVALANPRIRVAHVDRELPYTWMYNTHPDVDPERALGKRLDDILPPEEVVELMRLREEVLSTGRGVRREISIRFPSGRAVCNVRRAAGIPLERSSASPRPLPISPSGSASRRRGRVCRDRRDIVRRNPQPRARRHDHELERGGRANVRLHGNGSDRSRYRHAGAARARRRVAQIRQGLEAGAPVTAIGNGHVYWWLRARHTQISMTHVPLPEHAICNI